MPILHFMNRGGKPRREFDQRAAARLSSSIRGLTRMIKVCSFRLDRIAAREEPRREWDRGEVSRFSLSGAFAIQFNSGGWRPS
jgi:hypothetical protein